MENKIADKILDWSLRPARWYQFWLPSSGPIGGAISGIIAGILLILFLEFLLGGTL